jgi:hypothetical protein
MPLVALVAIVVAACGSAAQSRQPAVGSVGTAAASATHTAPATVTPSPIAADTTSWLPFMSKFYGYTISHPAGWTVAPGSGHWSLANPADESEDILTSPSGPPSPVGPPNLAAFELKIPSGMTADAFIEAYGQIAHVSDCYPFGTQLPKTMIDEHAATIAYGGCVQQYYFAEAIAVIGNRIWIFNLHGPDQSLIVPFLSTVKIDVSKVID